MKIKPYFFHFIILLLAVFGKLTYALATNDSLFFILKPLSSIVSFIMSSDFIYINESGFYFKSLNITIDKSCSGINFWIISFVMFSFSFLKLAQSYFKKILLIPILLVTTFIFTLFANTSRILTSIIISKHTLLDYAWLHQAEGVFIYLSLLILAYTILNHSHLKFNNYDEKLT